MHLPQAILDRALQDPEAKNHLHHLHTRHAPRCHKPKSATLHGGSGDSKRWRLWWECNHCGAESDPFILI